MCRYFLCVHVCVCDLQCWRLKFFVTTQMAIENISLTYVSGSWLFDWWWIDLHHCFCDEIWFSKKIWCCFVIKNKPCNLNSLSPLRWVGFVLFNTNHCHIPWKGKAKYLWLFEFQIIILHLQLELTFNCNLEDGIQSCCWHYKNPCFFTRNFVLKNPFWTSITKKISIILDKSFWTCPSWPSHVLFD